MSNQSEIRVRFAPSPTGFLHVGGLRTALFNFLFARKTGGKFILRIEDTDKSREVPGAVDDIIKTLQILGLNFDEGPFFQSQRLEIYQKYADELIKKGAAYKCYCSEERIAELKKQAELEKRPSCYDKHCLKNPPPHLSSPKGFVIRQNIPEEGSTEFEDLIHGKIKVQNRLLDNGILLKSDGSPVYNLANVIDDHLMGITHVIRGEEFIPSTPKHILLYQTFGWQLPQFAHLPLILDKERRKLSKRTGDVAVKEYLDQGYLPEAILNFIAFLGWNPKTKQEIFSLKELIEAFDLKKINKAGAIFDLEKLKWFNAYYLKRLPSSKLLELARAHFPVEAKNYPDKYLGKILEIEKERLTTLSEIGERAGYFFQEPGYDKKLLKWKNMTNKEISESLKISEKIISNFPAYADASAGRQFPISKQEIEKIFFEEIGAGDKGILLWPLRVALTGLKASPPPFEILEAFFVLPDGKEAVLNRIQQAIEKL